MSRDDPMDRARAALDAAREARGASDDEDEPLIVDPRDPMGAAEAALARARSALDAAKPGGGGGGRVSVAEAMAAGQLSRLKKLNAQGGLAAGPNEAADGADDDTEEVTKPRVRRL